MGTDAMPDLEPPTLGEVMRRLDNIVSQLGTIASEMKQDRLDAAKTYVRQDLYLAQRQADQAISADLHSDIQSIKSDRAKDQQQRRQMNMWVAGLTVTVLLAIAGMVVQILMNG